MPGVAENRDREILTVLITTSTLCLLEFEKDQARQDRQRIRSIEERARDGQGRQSFRQVSELKRLPEYRFVDRQAPASR